MLSKDPTKLPDTDGRLQMETVTVTREPANEEVRFLKVRITQGWDDFCSIHEVAALTDD